MSDYPAPVNQLLSRGAPSFGDDWPNYLEFGLGPEHIPDLIRLATDPVGFEGNPESKEVWGPLHAWRALGQLRAEEAIHPLLELLHQETEGDGDWGMGELPTVFAMIGPAALPHLAVFVADPDRSLYARTAVAEGLPDLVARFPETREQVIDILARQLGSVEEPNPELNGFVVSALLELKAVEAAPVLERAFAERAVDESIAGGWPEVQYELGLTDTPPPPRRFNGPGSPSWEKMFPAGPAQPARKTAKDRAKARRKNAAKARKRNRKNR
jgi:hypothetical protein